MRIGLQLNKKGFIVSVLVVKVVRQDVEREREKEDRAKNLLKMRFGRLDLVEPVIVSSSILLHLPSVVPMRANCEYILDGNVGFFGTHSRLSSGQTWRVFNHREMQ